MCLTCLNNELNSIEDYNREIRELLTTINCECCKSFPNFLLGVNEDLKILTLTKIKKRKIVCPDLAEKIEGFEGMVEARINHKLNSVLEQVDDASHELSDGLYLTRMNELKDINDMLTSIKEADHR